MQLMSRLPRICPIGIPQHIIQRGNNRQLCFYAERDFINYISWLKGFSVKFGVEIHAWVLMNNHVHLLCTPQQLNAISHMMQALGRQYVRYFNYNHNRTGTLWEGRFKSCLVEDERYLLHVYRYIELNPVRAEIVQNPADYRWSSYQINGLGKSSGLCTPHALYLSLGRNTLERQSNYRQLFVSRIDHKLLGEIRVALNSGMALGNNKFKQELEKQTGRRLHKLTRGRKLGQCKNQI
jgi:putative transposase